MSMRPTLGLLAAVSLLCAGNSLAGDPAQSAVSEGASQVETAESSTTADGAQAAADAEATEEGSAEAKTPEETSIEEAAAQVQSSKPEAVKPFDATKASKKELDAHNATLEPEQRIKCVMEYPTGSRRPTKVCLTQAQWREWNRQN